MANPLAEILRPKNLDEFIGQEHLVGIGKPLRTLLESGQITSMIFWGPPGCGKTTLARIIPKYISANFVPFSAVGGSIKEVRKIIETAKETKKAYGKETILFVDEIHRFNKAQQDAFLPAVEAGTIILIGATTENPGFQVISPLISRSHVYVFNKLTDESVEKILKRAIIFANEMEFETELSEDLKKEESREPNKWDKDAISYLVRLSDGDARKAINGLVLAHALSNKITVDIIETALQRKTTRYDRAGDDHYDTISAFIKSMRGSDPDATLHYLARMIIAGEDPIFIARRMLIFAAEDIGNAKPNALVLATSTMQAVSMIGMPESQLILAQCATYLATCPKSIAVTTGIFDAMKDIHEKSLDPIPLHLRNAANKVMKEQGYGKDHERYPWLEEKKTGKKVNQEYMPKNLKGKKYYKPEEMSE